MPRRRPVRVTRDQPGDINSGSYGHKAPPMSHSTERWASRMGSSAAGAQEVLVKISGGGRDADGVPARATQRTQRPQRSGGESPKLAGAQRRADACVTSPQ
jgi:hypothetical protein